MANDAPRHVYWLNFQSGHGERAIKFNTAFETHLASVGAVAEALARDGVVSGQRLDLVEDGRGGKMIRGRQGFAFSAAGLVSIQDYIKPVWEPED